MRSGIGLKEMQGRDRKKEKEDEKKLFEKVSYWGIVGRSVRLTGLREEEGIEERKGKGTRWGLPYEPI